MDGKDFEAFVQEHQRMVRAIAAQIVGRDNADDVAQEAFLRAFRGMGGVRDERHVRTWLYSLSRNAAIDWLRARKGRTVSIEEAGVDVAKVETAEPDGRLEPLMKAVESLRADYREIILLRYVEKLSYAQIAQALDMTPGAVGEKLHRVREMIMQRCGV